MSVTNDLVTDQRVLRSCSALLEAGYEVTLVGRRTRRTPEGMPDSWRALPSGFRMHRMRLLFARKAVFYAEYNLRLFLRLLFSRADLFYSNDTDTLPANWLAACVRRKPLFFDAHEMFPEVPELVGRPRVKRVWTAIEDAILPRMARRCGDSYKGKVRCATVTVCRSIADIYRERYGLQMGVVRNVPADFPVDFEAAAGMRAAIPADRKILLYQGAVNIGRGIEWMMDAMPLLPDFHLVVAGVGDIYDDLLAEQERGHIGNCTFLGRVEPRVLHAFTFYASLGLSLLENRGLNYYYSLPNRIADFVQAGVPVLATDFPEIHRVVAGYRIGTLVPPASFDSSTGRSVPPDPHELANVVRATVAEWEALPEAERQSRFAVAAADLSWNSEKMSLLSQINTIISPN